MRRVTYTMSVSLDGFITDPGGGLDWGAPDDEVFSFATDEVREVAVYLLGRRLYETMLYWETADEDPALGEARRRFAELWRAIPKVVFSTTLTTVVGNARLASRPLADEIERLGAATAGGDIAVGGAALAAAAAGSGLIDEYRPRVCPVLVGGGTPYFPRTERRVDLELVETRAFRSGVNVVRYRVKR